MKPSTTAAPPAAKPNKASRRSGKLGTRSKAIAPAPAAALPAPAPALNAKQLASKSALHPVTNAAAVIEAYGQAFGENDLSTLVTSLSDSIKGVNGGDMSRPEAMLMAQATALQSIFMNFSRRALDQQYLSNLESYLRMALKAQNQCRMTLETLATIKNPPLVIARQANINNGGQQQVNNGSAPTPPAPTPPAPRAAETVTPQNELLGKSDGQWLDTGAQGQAGRADQVLATVGKVHRAADEEGQGQDGAERLQGRPVA